MIEFITVVRNDIVGLKKTIASLNRVFSIELHGPLVSHLIIDGCSTDGTIAYVDSLDSTVGLPTKFYSGKDKGIYDAMNKGVSRSESKYVNFLNAGDELDPDLDGSELINLLLSEEHKESDLIGFSTRINFSDSKVVVRKPKLFNKKYPQLVSNHQSIIYRRSSLVKYPYNIDLKICGDFEQYIRLVTNGAKVTVSDRVLSNFYSGGVSTMKPLSLIQESVSISYNNLELDVVSKVYILIRMCLTTFMFGFLHKISQINKK